MIALLPTRVLVALALIATGAGAASAASTPACDALSAEQRARADALMTKIFPHDCCDDTLASCLAAAAPSRLVKRLATDVCTRVSKGEEDKSITRHLEQRAVSMIATGKRNEIDLAQAVWAGDPAAPVQVVAYACARCPFCAKSVPALYRAVTEGPLKGKARLAFRPFPLKSHEGAVEAGLAFEAARALGHFWPFALRVYAGFDDFAPAKLTEWAAGLGVDRAAFERARSDPATRTALAASKKEGIRNGVNRTPTYFLSAREYKGDMDDWALLDAILEEHDRVSGTLCKP